MDAVRIIMDMVWRRMTGEITMEQCEKMIAPLRDVETVVHGYWIDIDTETYMWKIRCSQCNHERSMMSTGKTYPMYCENCGARMDGKGNNG